MKRYRVILAVARGRCFDTGRRIRRRVQARDRLEAALRAESAADSTLDEPALEYTYARRVIEIPRPVAAAVALPLAA